MTTMHHDCIFTDGQARKEKPSDNKLFWNDIALVYNKPCCLNVTCGTELSIGSDKLKVNSCTSTISVPCIHSVNYLELLYVSCLMPTFSNLNSNMLWMSDLYM